MVQIKHVLHQVGLEFTRDYPKGIEKENGIHRLRLRYRGAARRQLRVQDVDGVVTTVKAAGLKVMSEGGVAQPIPPKRALVADPNNFLLTPYSPCDGCAPGLAAPARPTK